MINDAGCQEQHRKQRRAKESKCLKYYEVMNYPVASYRLNALRLIFHRVKVLN
jgi:hypothetical protein